MSLRGRRDERIHGMNGPAARLAAGYQTPPFIGDGPIDSDNPAFEPQRQLTAKPFIKPSAPGTDRQALNAAAKLCERYYAEEDFVLIDPRKPFDNAHVGPRLGPLGNDIRIQ
jgi:hypothetical protein